MPRRLLCIWFPRLASQASLRQDPAFGPFALTLRSGSSNHLHCIDPVAEARGLAPGMTLADAWAICPDLTTRPADPMVMAQALAGLRRWATRYSPLVSRDGDAGLVADITGVAHLFGGEAALREDLHDRLLHARLHGISAIADTRGAAHALARHGGGILPVGQTALRLASLPVTALRIDPPTAEALARAGLGRIGNLLDQPRAPLARRFGQGLLMRLDQLLGHQPEPVDAETEAPAFGTRLTLPEPIGLQSDVAAALDRLLVRLCAKLALHHHGARRLRLELRRVDRATVTLEIGLARPMRDPARIAPLFVPSLERVDSGFGIDALRLIALVTQPQAPAQIALSTNERVQDALAGLLSRLGNRLGFDAILRPLPAGSLVPERSFFMVPSAFSEPAVWSGPALRPLLLGPFHSLQAQARAGHPPSQFGWSGRPMTTLRAAGPERIAPEWWQDDPDWNSGMRDYWQVETQQGPRLWLFHTPQSPGWHLAGEFA
ncbi:Y-family DNA polymerase [Paracoccus sp. (in: a-proteobacteria)]|uniref:Y-family DNA polymerase n=1 Tax=Paracoccus sp. TaxID=267 RepID=UPI00396CC487